MKGRFPIRWSRKDSCLKPFGLDSIYETSKVLAVLLWSTVVPAAPGHVVSLDSDPHSIEGAAINRIKHLIDLSIGIFCCTARHVNVSLEASVFCVFEVLKCV